MENKINIAELLKDCPSGMELDCTMYEDVYFDYIDKLNIIHCYIQHGTYKMSLTFNQFGTPNSHLKSKCVIYPKGKTTWEGFQRPFKDGDVVFYDDNIAIFKEWGDETLFRTYVTKYLCCDSLIDKNVPLFGKYIRKNTRLATEEEKQKLFQAIKDNGYKWNPETKTLEKLIVPKFKVGDKIRHKDDKTVITITGRKDDYYFIEFCNINKNRYQTEKVLFKDQDEFELVPNKFDINTLKPFEKVLVRYGSLSKWNTGFFSHTVKSNNKLYFIVNTQYWEQCIPYKGNEHLRGTTDACSDYFKTWE